MARLITLILLLATLSCTFGLKKDKFKIKAKGFGLKNLQAVPVAAAAPAPYYPPAAPAPYYPQAAAAPAAPAYPAAAPSGGYGYNGFNGAQSAATSASFTAGSGVAPHVVPVIIPIALMTQPQVSSSSLTSQPSFAAQSSGFGLGTQSAGFGLGTQSAGFGLGSQISAAQSYIPRVDLEYVTYPVSDMGSAYGFSALKGNSFDSFNSADQFDNFASDGFSSGTYSG